MTLFLFILFCNWLEMIPTGHDPQYLPAPTGDVNLTYAMALTVIILVHATWIRTQGTAALPRPLLPALQGRCSSST